MNEKQFGRKIALLRKNLDLTQEEFAERLHISPQAVSKWENGHSLPETALLPSIARLFDISIDELFNENSLVILEALYGDGMDAVNVTKRLNRLVENNTLDITVNSSLLNAEVSQERALYLTVKYQSAKGVCFIAAADGGAVNLTGSDTPVKLPENGLNIIAGCYGTKPHHYDVMQKMEHLKFFNWNAYHANHETFPSDPANDETEYLTLVYLNGEGIHMATCAEGESLAYQNEMTELVRQYARKECFLKDVPVLPSFGEGMECSWAAALTVALQAMKVDTTYDEVMGNSGACWRLAFCSPGWDYSSVDGLVAYDYASPGFAAYGFTPVQYHHIEKSDRAEHRGRIMKELRNGMPVLGINLRVAPEWGVICGYTKDGEDLYCRTKYDKQTIENDPALMSGFPLFVKDPSIPDDYLYVDNWPFLLCYFDKKRKAPSATENLLESLRIFTDCIAKEKEGGYFMGLKAYEVWTSDLRDTAFYENCDDGQLARRFSVNQFCVLSLLDARQAAYNYLSDKAYLVKDGGLQPMIDCFKNITQKTREMHRMLDSGEALDGARARRFWTYEMRSRQAGLMDEIAGIERTALEIAKTIIEK